MNTKTLALMAAAVTLVGLPACSQRATDLPPGKYESNTKSVNEQGTATTRSTETEVEVDEYGNKKATTETTTTKDPKGLFNKTTSTSKSTQYDER